MRQLVKTLQRIDGRGYKAYRDIAGRHPFEEFELEVVHVQGDPFASPSRLAVRIPMGALELEAIDPLHPDRIHGVEDALCRTFAEALNRISRSRGSGKSGRFGFVELGQRMLPRTACELSEEDLLVRFTAGLPARGRRVMGRQAEAMLTADLPEAVLRGLLEGDLDPIEAAADSYQDQQALRRALDARGWIAFVADGAVLPRASGVDDRPLQQGAVPFASPEGIRATVDLPHAGKISGAAIEEGVTLICGGGYHGKSTLLRTLADAIYNHAPGDGRELCATRRDAAHVRAEDGRSVRGVDISAFIATLPDGRATDAFSTDNASGSTSQAANIVEAIEVGATALLIDEDTSATNFMVRDRRMQELIRAEEEPITPFVDRVRQLYERLGVSSILVVGGSGDYFDVADRVIVMRSYVPHLETARAEAIAARFPADRLDESRAPVSAPSGRVPLPGGLDPSRGKRRERVRAHRAEGISFGTEEIDIQALAQLAHPGQARTVADWLLWCSRELVDGRRDMAAICEGLAAEMRQGGLSARCAPGFGDRVYCRPAELAFALNRLRTLKVTSAPGPSREGGA